MAEVRAACGGARRRRRARRRWCWTSTRRCMRCTRRTRTRRRRTTRAGSGSIRSTASPMPPARRSAVLLRPGNAGANTIADHVAVLDQAIAQLPAEVAVGHRAGDDPGLVRRAVQVRGRLGGVHRLRVALPRDRNVGFAVVARSNTSHSRGDQPDRRRRRRVAAGAPPRRRGTSRRRGGRAHRSRRPVRLAGRDPADRAPRTVASRRPADPVPLDCCSATGATTPTPPATPSPSTCTCAPTPTSKTTSAD